MTWVTGWHWLALAVVLIAMDIFWRRGMTTGFWVACVATALADSILGLAFAAQVAVAAVVFVIAQACYWILNRAAMPKNATAKNRKQLQRMLGMRASLLAPIRKGHGKVQINDVLWDVRCDQPAKKGDLIEVVGYSDNSLEVTPIKLANQGKPNHN